MSKRSKKNRKLQSKVHEFVVVAFTKDMEQAKHYEALLKTNDVPATIKEQNDYSIESGNVAVLVPEEFLDEAHIIIESQDAYDDFYDFAAEDEELEDLNCDFFDDDF